MAALECQVPLEFVGGGGEREVRSEDESELVSEADEGSGADKPGVSLSTSTSTLTSPVPNLDRPPTEPTPHLHQTHLIHQKFSLVRM